MLVLYFDTTEALSSICLLNCRPGVLLIIQLLKGSDKIKLCGEVEKGPLSLRPYPVLGAQAGEVDR